MPAPLRPMEGSPMAFGRTSLFALANLKAEPTGALSLGAVLAEPDRFRGKRVCCVISGGNADPALYAELVEGI